MVYVLSFAGAAFATALVVALARLLLTVVLSEPMNHIPPLCVGTGFLIGRYAVSGPISYPDTIVSIAQFGGSALCLIILGAIVRYRARRVTAA